MKCSQPSKTEIKTEKSDFLKKFEMKDGELIEDEHEDHVHVEGCCSCHSNVGK